MRRPTCRPSWPLRTRRPEAGTQGTAVRPAGARYCGDPTPPGEGPMPDFTTHEVFNQPEPLVDRNLFDSNQPLRDALAFNAPGLDTAPLQALGALVGSAQMQSHARLANV